MSVAKRQRLQQDLPERIPLCDHNELLVAVQHRARSTAVWDPPLWCPTLERNEAGGWWYNVITRADAEDLARRVRPDLATRAMTTTTYCWGLQRGTGLTEDVVRDIVTRYLLDDRAEHERRLYVWHLRFQHRDDPVHTRNLSPLFLGEMLEAYDDWSHVAHGSVALMEDFGAARGRGEPFDRLYREEYDQRCNVASDVISDLICEYYMWDSPGSKKQVREGARALRRLRDSYLGLPDYDSDDSSCDEDMLRATYDDL